MVTSEENYKVTLKALNHLQNFPDVKIAFSLSDPGIVMGFKDKFLEMESFGLDYIFGNDDEAMAFVDADNIDDAKEKTLFELDDAINIRRGCYEVLKSNENEK